MGGGGKLSWDEFLTPRDRAVFAAAGYGRRMELGKRPALLVIDVTYEFTGPAREPILEAIKKVKTACGEEAWAAVDCLKELLPLARARGVPVIYTVVDREHSPYSKKNRRADEAIPAAWRDIVAEVAPGANDLIVRKTGPSAFFGTNLIYHLVRLGVDTVLFAGGVTSGCVRASAVDAFAYGYRVGVITEAVFDRGQASQAISLFDLQAKYASVLSAAEAAAYLESL